MFVKAFQGLDIAQQLRLEFPFFWQDTEKLVAFLFGITSHMVADVSWHSLGIEQGFLRTMGAVSVYGHEGATAITPISKRTQAGCGVLRGRMLA